MGSSLGVGSSLVVGVGVCFGSSGKIRVGHWGIWGNGGATCQLVSIQLTMRLWPFIAAKWSTSVRTV